MDYRQRRKEQAQQTEQAILQAAMELARENSFDKVSVRDICQRAGITTGAFYHHFRSKEVPVSTCVKDAKRCVALPVLPPFCVHQAQC